MKKIISTLLLATSVSQFGQTQTAVTISPEPGETVEIHLNLSAVAPAPMPAPSGPVGATLPKEFVLAQDLRALELPLEHAGRQEFKDRAQIILDKLRIKDLLSSEGVERIELPDAPRPRQFSTGHIIKTALEDAGAFPEKISTVTMGQKIPHYNSAVGKVLRASQRRDGERTARMTLNRAFDVVNSITTLTATPAAQALLLAGFYENAFIMALGQVNSGVSVYKSYDINAVTGKALFIADYGVLFANLMYDYTKHANITNTHKAVMTIKALGYLAWDLKLDIRGINDRSEAISNLLTKIYELQKENEDMNYLLLLISKGTEPDVNNRGEQALNRVSTKVRDIIREAPKAIAAANAEFGIR